MSQKGINNFSVELPPSAPLKVNVFRVYISGGGGRSAQKDQWLTFFVDIELWTLSLGKERITQ